jgi:hypothetical protein
MNNLCKKWKSDKNKNPITNRKIKTNAITYKNFMKLCNNNDNNNNDNNNNDNNNNDNNNIICKKWLLNRTRNPISNIKIKIDGPMYNKLNMLCVNNKIFNFLKPLIKRVTANIIDRINYFIIINNYINKIKDGFIEKINDKIIIGNRIILDKQIGNIGKYGIVYKAHYKPYNIQKKELGNVFKFVVKICELNNMNKKEIETGKKLNKLLVDFKCPHFPFLYGYIKYNKKLDFISEYFTFNKSYFIIYELANGTFSQLILDSVINNKVDLNNIIKNALIQIYLSMIFFNKYSALNHNDTHFNNFLYHKIKKGGYFYYKFYGKDYYLENIGYLWVINDFGLITKLKSSITDLKFFTEKMLNTYIKLKVFNNDINNFIIDMMKLLSKKNVKINMVIDLILNFSSQSKPDKIINITPYIIE